MIIVDRRGETGRSNESRRRFFERIKGDLGQSLKSGLNQGKTDGLSSPSIQINKKSISEPSFRFAYDYFLPGEVVVKNYAYNKGDIIEDDLFAMLQAIIDRAGDGEGDGDLEGLDFDILEKEFADLLFKDLELPNFIEKDNPVIDETKFKHAGFIKDGLPSNLNIRRSFIESFSRRIATRGVITNALEEIQKKIDQLEAEGYIRESLIELDELYTLQESLTKKRKSIPFFHDTDLRYNTRVPVIHKITSAVLFLICDVSGSMEEDMKDSARKFFHMFYLFLKHNYQNVEVVFIIHTTDAQEVSEKIFFTTRLSGGTSFLPVYELINKIISTRYNPQRYNIYFCHASDSEAYDGDEAVDLIQRSLIDQLQFGCYLHVQSKYPDYGADFKLKIKNLFEKIKPRHKVAWDSMDIKSDPYRVLRKFFGKRSS